MARGYLLDTNILRYWFDQGSQEHQKVVGKINDLQEGSPLAVSVVTLGEMQFGLQRALKQAPGRVSAITELLQQLPDNVLPVGRSTTLYYGRLRFALFETLGPKKRRPRSFRLSQLIDPISLEPYGIQENDVWIAAQAIERNLVLVTHDKKATRPLAGVTPFLSQLGLSLELADWAE